MEDSGMAMIGMGESDSGDRAIDSVNEALNSPLLDLDISTAKSALVNICGSSDLTLNEAEKIVQIVGDELEDYLVVNNEESAIEIKNKILKCLEEKDKVLELFKKWSSKNKENSKNDVKHFLDMWGDEYDRKN